LAANRAYIDGLKLLARRELSEAQVRQRLARKGHEPDAIDDAIQRLRDERALDDERAAGAIARTQTSLKGRGRARVRREIERAGIARPLADRAVDAAFEGQDDDALLEEALRKRLRGRSTIADERETGRLYRYLIGQGFDPERVLAALARRKAQHD
jgi:regulatory protein